MSIRKIQLAFVAIAFALQTVAVARAAEPARTPAQLRDALATHAQTHGIPAYKRTMAPGNEKVYLNATPAQIRALDPLIGQGTDVLQIVHFGEPGAMHTMALFDGEPVHTQYQGANWRLRRWRGPESFSQQHWLYSSVIKLEPGEADSMRKQIAAARVEQGDEAAAGPGWQNGHIRTAFGNRSFNCCSLWSEMSLGDAPLWKKLGMRYGGGSPPDFQRRLESEANDRVVGHILYGPKQIPEFGKNPNTNQFTFQNPAP